MFVFTELPMHSSTAAKIGSPRGLMEAQMRDRVAGSRGFVAIAA